MNSRARTRERDEAATLSALSSWETQVDKAFIWMPYVLLAISLGVAQFGSKTFGNRLIEIGLAVAAAGWTWVTFTRKGRPSTIGQGALQVYFIGFVFLALLLVLRSPVFLVYGLTGPGSYYVPPPIDVTLGAVDLPNGSFGFFQTSRQRGDVFPVAGSMGRLCLSGPIGRYVGPGQIRFSGMEGRFDLAIDLGAVPTPTGLVAVQAGDTWNFQAWFRDAIGGAATSNFTNGLEVVFR